MCRGTEGRSASTLGTGEHEAERGIGCKDQCIQTREAREAKGGREEDGPAGFGDLVRLYSR